MTIGEFLQENWPYILAVLLGYLSITNGSKIHQWLIYACTVSEKEMGGGTGKIKLRMVYDLFIKKFPVIASIFPFFIFSMWVNHALKQMNAIKDSNSKVAAYLEGGTKKDENKISQQPKSL